MDGEKPLETACRNCGAALAGEWCSACGERRWRASDRSLGALAREAFGALTDWDGRILGTLRALLAAPGRLSSDWIEGRRRRWLGPMALFLLANVAYFLAAPMTDFDLSLRDQVDLQPHRALARSMVDARLAARGIGFDEYAAQYAAASGNLAKSLIIWHVPWLALGLALLAGWRRWQAADHLVVALHLFTVLIALVMVVGWIVLPLAAQFIEVLAGGRQGLRAPLQLGILALLLGHWTLACRRVYGFGALRTALAPLVLVVAFVVGHFSYRLVQFLVVFAMT
jgi:hypothetical protein